MLETPHGRILMRGYFEFVIDIARRDHTGVVIETPTWRASSDWGTRLGYTPEQLDKSNLRAVGFFANLRLADPDIPVVISGNLGPRGDGYTIDGAMTADYHATQIGSLAAAGADLMSAFTLNYSAEAVGVVEAANWADIPVVISFTVETDGALPSGQPLTDAIDEVDRMTGGTAAYFMVNCAHPTHFVHVLSEPGPWDRLRGIRANASRMSHEELDNATALDCGNQTELAELLPQLAVVGGRPVASTSTRPGATNALGSHTCFSAVMSSFVISQFWREQHCPGSIRHGNTPAA